MIGKNIINREILPKKFYKREADIVARNLLGKLLIKWEQTPIGGKIVETEAYLGFKDPASISYLKRKRKLSEKLYREPGTLFIYMVHGNWLLNIIVDEKHFPAAVLIRALEPVYGIELMKKYRPIKKIKDLTSGPGKLTRALNIGKEYNSYNVSSKKSPINILDYENIEEKIIVHRHRIGVVKDLEIPLRFYIKDDNWVSKK